MSRTLHTIFTFLALTISLSFLFSPPALAEDPFPPFSVEGNPETEYYFETLFPFFAYIKPGFFQVYENRDRSREYENLEICPGKDRDHRDYYCNDAGDGCDGGDVEICHKGKDRGKFAYMAHSSSGKCKLNKPDPFNPDAMREGVCEYRKRPKVISDIKGTDFSREQEESSGLFSFGSNSSNPTDTAETEAGQGSNPFEGLTYPKLQNEALSFSNIGNDNALSWGTHYLTLNQCERGMRQLLVVTRAKQTKATLAETGEWPLGWVDWGYQTNNGKTLLEIQESLPGTIAGPAWAIVESSDDFFLNAGNLDAVTDVSEQKERVCKALTEGLARDEQWALDLTQAPIYPPSFRQGYVRGSICVWDLCCPGLRCPLNRDLEELLGQSKSLYYDISISQTFGAALDDFLLSYNLEEGAKIFAKMASSNQLIRFLGSASPNAVPSVVSVRLDGEISDPCYKYHRYPFLWSSFGLTYDYLEGDPKKNFLDPDKKCPGYILQPELTKEKGGAFPDSLLQRIINLIWVGVGGKVDDVEPVKYHLITVPDAMGQSISLITQKAYDTRDTLLELESQVEYNKSISNIVDDNKDFLYAGKSLPIGDAKRRLAYFTCASPEYSVPQETGIEAYALGTRVGCYGETNEGTGGLCDPSKFEKLIADSPWQEPLPQATEVVLNSEMFVDGKLNPKLEEAYAAASDATGVPCEVLAGLHFEEASAYFTDLGGPEKRSVENGGELGGESLSDSATGAAHSILRHPPSNTSSLITSISNFNGGGNSNCQQGYPYPIPYGGCPRSFIGDDDPYATNLLDSRHTNMWLLYHGDFAATEPTPYGEDRPGAFSVALIVYNEATSKNLVSPSASPSPSGSPTTGNNSPFSTFTPNACGDNALDTALGCLPYKEGLTETLLTFLIGLSGAISLIVMLTSTIQMMTAAGDIEKTTKARELFTAAVVGLLFIIFSVTLLRIIAGDIIKLPGF